MRKPLRPILFLCCILSGLMYYSCTKDNSPGNSDTNTQSASDDLFAQGVNDDAMSMSAQSEDNGTAGTITDSTYGYMLSPCATVSIDLSSVPNMLTIDFGNTNCLCFDGKYRRGKILVSFNGFYRDSGSTHTIGFDNYYVNDYKVEGTQTVINTGHNANGNLEFSVQVSSTITDTSGQKLTYTSTRTREWVAGESTDGLFGWTDDVYSITGTASGKGFDGTEFTSNISSPLIVALNCKWVEKGTIEFTPADKITRTIDFGNGDCDNKVTVSIAGLSFNILLP